MNRHLEIKGADISTLIEEESCGAVYFDNGKKDDLLNILKRYGINSARIRLFNDPYSESGEPYGAGTNDLEKTLALAKRAKMAGMSILLDLHYSDFWADPGKQNVPKAWRGLKPGELADKIYDYTAFVLKELEKNGTVPEMVQVGNEITNGLLWPTGKKPEYDNIALYVGSGIRAVNDFAPGARTMIHLDNGGNNPMYIDWFDNYIKRGPDFDIIGFSYYPFWHGNLADLEYNIRDMAKRYHKDLVVAEVSMGFSMEDYRSYEGKPIEELKGYATKQELVEKLEYPMTPKGQSDFMNDFMTRISDIEGCLGFYYWEPGWIPVPGCGWATEAALKYTGEKGPGGNEWANQALFDYDGNALPALEVIKKQ